MNNPQEILSLMPRDVIADEHNNQYVVVAHLVDRLVVQHTCVISPNNAGKWTRCIPPTPAPIPRPSASRMHEELLAAGFIFAEDLYGRRYKNARGIFFRTVEAAWDTLAPAAFKRPLESARTPRENLQKSDKYESEIG